MSRPEIEFDAPSHTYKVNGESGYPSVTTIIGATVAKPFSIAAWWGYKLGVGAVHELLQDPDQLELFPSTDFKDAYDQAKTIQNPNSVRDKAGDRGNAIHNALELYAKEQIVPVPADFPMEDRKRITGVAGWLLENRPEYHGSEVRTASLEHRYVGSLDAYLTFRDGPFAGKTARVDYKTSKNVYPNENFPQLAAYEQAEIECGEEPSDLRIVLHIPENGRCKMVVVTDTFDDFKVLLDSYNSLQERKRRIEEMKREGEE